MDQDRIRMFVCFVQTKFPWVYVPEVSMDRIRIEYPAGYLPFFRIRIGFGYLFLKKIGSGQDQDIGLISITKLSWEWYKMSQIMVAVFSLLLLVFILSVVLHSSKSMVIRFTSSLIFSGQVEVVNCSYIASMLLCFFCWMAYVCAVLSNEYISWVANLSSTGTRDRVC